MKSRCFNSRLFLFLLISMMSVGFRAFAVSPRVAYDMDMACEICADLPLETVEGVWLYPEDNVTVLILKNQNPVVANVYSTYTISVVETSDARLHPGDILGQLSATPESGVYKIELATEKKNDFLLKPKTCMANLGKDGDTFIFKKRNSNIKTRLNLNLNRLLPGFWKIVGIGLSSNSGNSAAAPVGMIKVYPSYDGNGSSRRETRYL